MGKAFEDLPPSLLKIFKKYQKTLDKQNKVCYNISTKTKTNKNEKELSNYGKNDYR